MSTPFDCHLHTLPFSQDARQRLPELLQALTDLRIGGILTEHLDYDFPLDPSIVIFEPDEYFATYGPLRSERLLLGVEIGMQRSCRAKNKSVVSDYPWDFVLASVHMIDGLDPYTGDYYKNFGKSAAYHRYLEVMIEEIRGLEDFDSLGHIDYICRYNDYADPDLHYHDDADLWDVLFKELAEREKALEINTRRFKSTSAKDSLFELCRRFKELGGRYVTVGSDAHVPTAVGGYLREALDMAEAAKLQPVYFKERKMLKNSF